MNKPSLLLTTDRLILRSLVESDVPKLKAFDERNANRLSPWRSTEPGGKLDYVPQVMKWKQELEDGRAIRFLLVSRADPEGEIILMLSQGRNRSICYTATRNGDR